jgi:membrane fusion protein (multidrug efflux system)
MYAAVQIGIERHDDALLLPVAAVLMEKTNASVFTVVANVAKKHPVKIGFSDGAKVEIVEGVKPDESVLLIGKRSLSDGQLVQVTGVK